WAITQKHEVPLRVPFRYLPIFGVSSDEPREILFLDESRRSKKVIFGQPVFLSNFQCSLPAVASAKVGISSFAGALAEMIVVHDTVPSKNSPRRHSKFNQILHMTLPTDERGGVKIDDPPLDHFLPPRASFILSRALGHDDHRYSATHTAIRSNERSQIVPAVNRHHIGLHLPQSLPKRAP